MKPCFLRKKIALYPLLVEMHFLLDTLFIMSFEQIGIVLLNDNDKVIQDAFLKTWKTFFDHSGLFKYFKYI